MTARVLVVDDIATNVKLLEARLSAEYFDVVTASSGYEALEVCGRERIDVVLLDVMMPGLDGYEVCRQLKRDAKTHHIPVVMITALDQPSDRLEGLECGADDFLTKPVDDIALITRVKNLARLKTLNDELLMRVSTGRHFGATENAALQRALARDGGKVMIVEDHEKSGTRMRDALQPMHQVVVERSPQGALNQLSSESFDLAIVSLSLQGFDGLRLCSQLRSLERTRHLPIVVLLEDGSDARLLRALDMGVNDYLRRPVEHHELLARVMTQIKRKRHSDFLRDQIEESFELAVTDGLTGLHNRHYMEIHLATLLCDAVRSGRELAILITDIDHFKAINDTYGHDIGDFVLKNVAERLRRNTRQSDLACRMGGEEFLLIMPDTGLSGAYRIGERIRTRIASEAFETGQGSRLRVTASVGIAALDGASDNSEGLLKRADNALYAAKRRGRNRIASTAA